MNESRYMERGEWEGEGPPPEFWHQALKNALRGKRGQGVLRELKEALLALPEKKLISGHIVKDGCCCAMGALLAKRLEEAPITFDNPLPTADRTVTSLAEFEQRLGDWFDDETGVIDVGLAMGLRQTLSWEIGRQNDEEGADNETDEERWWRVMRWIEKNLAEV